jgi:phospholipid N-methyltransferase
MAFNKQDKKIEVGIDFAKLKTPDFCKLYYKYNSLFAKLLVGNINKDYSKIADYGGGNAILAQEILKQLSKHKRKGTIDIIDIDKTKNIKRKDINYINADVLKHQKINYYDYSLSRFILHYFNKADMKKLMRNIYTSLKQGGYLLLVNWVVDDNNTYKKKRQILDYIEKNKKISCRNIPKTNEIVHICKNVGFSIIKKIKVTYSIRIEDFYKNRFDLSKEDVKKLIKHAKIKRHKESQIGLLLRK